MAQSMEFKAFVVYVVFYNKDYNPNKTSQLNLASCSYSIVKKKISYSSHIDKK